MSATMRRALLTALTGAALATALAAPARADWHEDMYLQLIRDSNLPKFGPETELAVGRQICAGWASGTQTAMDIANTTMAQHPEFDLAAALTYQTPATILCADDARKRKQ